MDINDEALTRIHSTLIEILDEIVRICELHNLRYYLIGGTLLGAIRHAGFIPWDDDLDIVMPRKDYESLMCLCETELDEAYYLQSYRNEPDFWLPFSKVRKKNTLFLENQAPVNFSLKKMGIFVDVFPLDDAKKERGFQRVQWKLFRLFRVMQDAKYPNTQVSGFCHFLSAFFSNQKLLRLQQWAMKLANEESKTYYVNFGSQYGIRKQTIAKDRYDPPTKVKFEGKKYNAPCDWDYFLKRIYGGSYMEIPSPEKRAMYPSHTIKRLSFDMTDPNETFENIVF